MQKPTNYDTTQAAGEFEPIKLGGHKMVIKQVSERQSQGGLNMIVILFDFAEGDEQAGYFMKQFENDIRPDKKYPNAGTNYMVCLLYTSDSTSCRSCCITGLAEMVSPETTSL